MTTVYKGPSLYSISEDPSAVFSPEDRISAQQAKRNSLVANAYLLKAHASQVHYIAQRPMHNERDHMVNVLKRFRHGIGIWMDCSESVSFLYYTSGCKDPNGMNFDGWGNSHTMWQHLNHRYTDPNRAHAGALGVYGPEGNEHVIMIVKHDAHDPLVFSHGQEAGPFIIPLSEESAGHRGQPFTFLDVSSLL